MNLFIPRIGCKSLSVQEIQAWYNNISSEIQNGPYSETVINAMNDPKNYYGKLLDKRTSRFYIHHFSFSLHKTINYALSIKDSKDKTQWLEVGAGAGNQVILLALCGFEIFAVDIDPLAGKIIKERQQYYEQITGRRLKINIVISDIMKYSGGINRFDIINFQFSFNNIGMPKSTIRYLTQKLSKGGLWIMHEGNKSSIFNSILRPNKQWMNPSEVAIELKAHNVEVLTCHGGYALPPIFFKYEWLKVLIRLDAMLTRIMIISNSYHLIGRKME
jgi:2-polyprenyl-3-methyl-5-hydroxy-6-metoxy-1,4-benzoquinol methylase